MEGALKTSQKSRQSGSTSATNSRYVVTRWYRAPEVILNASEYTKAVDIWSVGCILGELLGRTALFPGENYLDQIQRIISVLGTPSYNDISYITNEQALKFIKSLPKRSKQSFDKLFSKANPLALDLLENMLTFNPHDRYTVEDCLSHPYFEGEPDQNCTTPTRSPSVKNPSTGALMISS